ncbi:hypothetical protein C1H76_1155 [Elsinoe australis]|uniref:Uncharacterized protein n=1 Tax=Elsinoe australis TaxID=40998 RepID=A0A4U7B5E7_9PEZI|nr:hypothetical protein C1H76_1155 [Elsinoe australis]
MSGKPVTQKATEHEHEKASLSLLPHVVWRRIVFYLSGDLTALLHVSAFSADLQRICRPYVSSFFHAIDEPVAPLSKAYYYHDLLRLVLVGHLNASSIHEFYYDAQYTGPDPRFPPPSFSEYLSGNATDLERRSFLQLARQAVRNASFIRPETEDEIFARFEKGEQDVAIALLLPLCTSLKLVEPPVKSKICATLFQTIAQEYQRRGVSADMARERAGKAAIRDRTVPQISTSSGSNSSDALPFSELSILYIRSDPLGWSFSLVELAPFMAIPSLHRIILHGVLDQIFPGWPAGACECRCPEIYFQQSAVSPQAALAFAECLSPPCEVRQWYKQPRQDIAECVEGEWNHEAAPEWDHVVVNERTDGTKSVVIGLDYGGGNSPPIHAWVSWLGREKMRDWRRLDELFEVEEGDDRIRW